MQTQSILLSEAQFSLRSRVRVHLPQTVSEMLQDQSAVVLYLSLATSHGYINKAAGVEHSLVGAPLWALGLLSRLDLITDYY